MPSLTWLVAHRGVGRDHDQQLPPPLVDHRPPGAHHLTITITASHYWLDGAVAAVLVAWAVVVIGQPAEERVPRPTFAAASG